MGQLARLSGHFAVLTLLLGGACALTACETPAARSANATRSLDERRAIAIIQKAMQREGARPGPSREVTLVDGAPLRVDVSVSGHDYGVAYVTASDLAAAGSSVPPPNKKDERLRLIRAGEDGEAHIVLLYQSNYVYDDLVGADHEQTTITAERSLSRDVQDFITHARTQKYK